MDQKLAEQIRNCPNFPSLPAIAVRVVELAQDNNADITEIARVITKDPALSGKMLKTVNSSFYGRSKNVSTISQALVILGLQSVRTLVLGFSLVTTLSKNKSKTFPHNSFWKRSLFSATAAKVIAAKSNIADAEEAFLAALLMDIGMLALDSVRPEQYPDICAAVTQHDALCTAERAALETDHAEVSGLLADHWKLPAMLQQPLAFHHAPDNVADTALKQLATLDQPRRALRGCLHRHAGRRRHQSRARADADAVFYRRSRRRCAAQRHWPTDKGDGVAVRDQYWPDAGF